VVIASWKYEPLRSVATLQRGFDLPSRLRKPGAVPIITSSGIEDRHCQAKVKGPGVVTGRYGTIGEVFFVRDDFWPLNTTLYVRDFHENDPLFISYLLRTIDFHTHSGKSGVPGVNRNDLHEIVVPLPATKTEQEAIAEALSDADALIESLEQLLVKQRQLKQGAMQELLTARKRLPSFSGEWEGRGLGEIATANKGSQLSSGSWSEHGRFAHLNGGISPSGYTDKSNAPGKTIAISEGGNSCGYVQFMSEPYWCGGHCYSVIPNGIDNRFLYHALKGEEPSIMGLRVGSGLPNVQKTALLAFILRLPKTPEEQTAIATILSDMDAEVAELEAKLAKVRQLRQGMMQELLTGRIRLV